MAAARENKRSATAEILARLEDSFPGFTAADEPDAHAETTEAMVTSGPEPEDVTIKITRQELWEVIGQAVASALDERTQNSRPGPANAKTSTGPKPRKPYQKK